MEMDKTAVHNANEVIAALKKMGLDYSDKFQEIYALWDGEYGLWGGNDDACTDFEAGTRNIIVYQEDHMDQHMDEDDKPNEDDHICYAGDYVYFAD